MNPFIPRSREHRQHTLRHAKAELIRSITPNKLHRYFNIPPTPATTLWTHQLSGDLAITPEHIEIIYTLALSTNGHPQEATTELAFIAATYNIDILDHIRTGEPLPHKPSGQPNYIHNWNRTINRIIEPMITIGFRPDWEHHPKYTKTINGSKITLKKSSITPIRGREKKPQKPIHITHHPR